MEDHKIWLLRAESAFAMAQDRVSEKIFYADLCYQAIKIAKDCLNWVDDK